MEEKKERFLDGILRELCEEMDITLEKLSNDWVLQLSKDGKVRHITRNHFDINPHSSSEIADDKYATYEVLKSQKVPVIEHTILFNPATMGQYITEDGIWDTVAEEFSKHKCLVVKPNRGCEGNGIELCYTKKELEIAIEKLFQDNSTISICPYYSIETEYRTFYLNGQVHLIYGKNKPVVVGNGQATMDELVTQLHLPDKKVVKENLEKIDMTYIPKQNEVVEISWKHNLSGGSIPKVLEKGELYEKIENLSIRAGKAINMNFATIDIVQTVDGKLYVMEVNAGVFATIFSQLTENGYEMVKDIYRKALIAMFNNKKDEI